MRRDARLLKEKAVASLRRAATAFNSLEDAGRHTTVLVHLQHSFEMLLKAALHERHVPIVDPETGQSIGFKKCLHLSAMHLKVRAEDVGTLRAIDQLRDDEYHYLGLVSEGLLYLHLRAAISIFDRLMRDVFGQTLADQLYSQVKRLLEPGRRRGAEARGRIRTLLALEGHVTDDAEVHDADVVRVANAIRSGSERSAVLPRLEGLSSRSIGTEVSNCRAMPGTCSPPRMASSPSISMTGSERSSRRSSPGRASSLGTAIQAARPRRQCESPT